MPTATVLYISCGMLTRSFQRSWKHLSALQPNWIFSGCSHWYCKRRDVASCLLFRWELLPVNPRQWGVTSGNHRVVTHSRIIKLTWAYRGVHAIPTRGCGAGTAAFTWCVMLIIIVVCRQQINKNLHQWNWHISTHADLHPHTAQFHIGASLALRLRQRISMVIFTCGWAWPAPLPICPMLGFWGSKVHKNVRFPEFDADKPSKQIWCR